MPHYATDLVDLAPLDRVKELLADRDKTQNALKDENGDFLEEDGEVEWDTANRTFEEEITADGLVESLVELIEFFLD